MHNIRDLFTKTIAFRPELVAITGSINAALILSQGIYWQDKVPDGRKPIGWWYKTQIEWTKETGLTKTEITTARKKLQNTVFWHEQRKGIPAKMWFTIDTNKLEVAIKNYQCSTTLTSSHTVNSQPEVPEPFNKASDCPTSRNLDEPLQAAYKPPSITETTAKTTTKNTPATTSEIPTSPLGDRERGFSNDMLATLDEE